MRNAVDTITETSFISADLNAFAVAATLFNGQDVQSSNVDLTATQLEDMLSGLTPLTVYVIVLVLVRELSPTDSLFP